MILKNWSVIQQFLGIWIPIWRKFIIHSPSDVQHHKTDRRYSLPKTPLFRFLNKGSRFETYYIFAYCYSFDLMREFHNPCTIILSPPEMLKSTTFQQFWGIQKCFEHEGHILKELLLKNRGKSLKSYVVPALSIIRSTLLPHLYHALLQI